MVKVVAGSEGVAFVANDGRVVWTSSNWRPPLWDNGEYLGEPFRPFRHILVRAYVLLFCVSWTALSVDNFIESYGRARAWIDSGDVKCLTTPGYLTQRPKINWVGGYTLDIWCPSEEDAKKYPRQPWKWTPGDEEQSARVTRR